MSKVFERVKAAMKDITTVDSATQLNAEQQDNFIRTVEKSTPMLDESRLMEMDTPERDIDRTGFGQRILQAPQHAENAEPEPDFNTNTLTVVKVKAVIGLSDDTLEDNIERDGFEDTLVSMIAERAGIDMEQLFILGDEDELEDYDNVDDWADDQDYAAGDYVKHNLEVFKCIQGHTGTNDVEPGEDADWEETWLKIAVDEYETEFLGLSNTWTKRADNMLYYPDFEINTDDHHPEKVFDELIGAVDPKYIRQRGDWRLYTSHDLESDYRKSLRTRETNLGDATMTQYAQVDFEGVPVVPVGNLPYGSAIFTHPDNTVYGIRRDIRIEDEREAKKERTDFVVTARIDADFEDEEAVSVGMGYVSDNFDFDY